MIPNFHCDHPRKMSLSMKHDDRIAVVVPHLGVDYYDGYMPRIGVFGGDDTNITVCLDCGQIMNWAPITDQQIEDAVSK